MKVLHTSDWHLGQQFYEHHRANEHQQFFNWLIDTLFSEKIDLLLVAGDIYHTATPPASSENQLYQFIKDAKKRCPALQIVIIAGNHDSANRIMAAKPLLAQFDTHVVGRFDVSAPDDVVIRINTDSVNAHIVAMPFLRASDVTSLSNTDNGHDYAQGIAKAYQLSSECALKDKPMTTPLIIMGHLHAKGGDISSDSERNLIIGGEESVTAQIFSSQASYVALGHLHKAQKVAKSDTIRYSGTPMPMSFSERNYKHQVCVVEFTTNSSKHVEVTVNPLYIPRATEVILLPEGECVPVEQLCEQISNLDLSNYNQAPYLRVKLSAGDTDTTFREQIEKALENKTVQFCGIERVRQINKKQNNPVFEDLSQVEMLNPQTLLEQAFATNKDMAGQSVPIELKTLLNDLLSELAEQQQ
ncbi:MULTISPECIES: exonuclease SbcCD subunit D [Pseudoalteromonas]|uniref:exonuclease SbcCD subunit D n=1 Tax=Pseudoalteromonas TaxID=53246 RepID=UPI0002E68481|nr:MULTISPECIES: exonuclease SbcCD subunit D C-terminal domain-containing protein [Pseudoalteromonas]MCF6146229.1 exonuclease SbcD [Pseudoalteromonas mariniglutinosa NCIMB 1770]